MLTFYFWLLIEVVDDYKLRSEHAKKHGWVAVTYAFPPPWSGSFVSLTPIADIEVNIF